MKSIYRRHIHYTKEISESLYEKHKEKFVRAFGERIPNYAEVFEWINDACGVALYVYVHTHIKWDNTRPENGFPSYTSLPVFKARTFNYGVLSECPDDFIDDWEGCADYAIETILTKVYDNGKLDYEGPWYNEFTEEYDGSCEEYHTVEDYIDANKK